MQPDSTTISLILNDPLKLITFIATCLAIIASLFKLIPKCKHLWQSHWYRRSLRKRPGAKLYKPEDFIVAKQFYIRPQCQTYLPDQIGADSVSFEKEMQKNVISTQKKNSELNRYNLFKMMDFILSKPSKYNYIFLLADSGMGKTAFVLNYYIYHWRSFRRRHMFNLALVPLNMEEADSYIKKIKNKSNTVLFLDAFDEDTRAIQNHEIRIRMLLGLTREFRQVLITSRTQFFPTEKDIPQETGILKKGVTKAGESHEYKFYRFYLSPFSDEQIREYLKKRFSFWKQEEHDEAWKIVNSIRFLIIRPMLLTYIEDLVKSNVTFKYSFQIYEEMVSAWLEREKPFVKDTNSLRIFSEKLAIDLYKKRKERGSESVRGSELKPPANSFGIELDSWQLRARSLLNRDAKGHYKFAHRSIMEYLFVQHFLKMKSELRFKIIWTDQMKQFLKEILAFHKNLRKSPP